MGFLSPLHGKTRIYCMQLSSLSRRLSVSLLLALIATGSLALHLSRDVGAGLAMAAQADTVAGLTPD